MSLMRPLKLGDPVHYVTTHGCTPAFVTMLPIDEGGFFPGFVVFHPNGVEFVERPRMATVRAMFRRAKKRREKVQLNWHRPERCIDDA